MMIPGWVVGRMRLRVWFHRGSALVWVALGAVSFALGLQSSVVLVWLASVYANVKSDWGAAEAADDSAMVERLDRIEATQREILAVLRGEG